MDTEARGEAGTSQSQSRHKKGHMANIYLTDSDGESIYFVKDHKELSDKINEHFQDKAKKECLWERFASTRKLSVKVCKPWCKYQMTRYGNPIRLSLARLPSK